MPPSDAPALGGTETVGHLDRLGEALRRTRDHAGTIERWGARLADVLGSGGRLLACGNGGSAAEAQHLTGELVGKFRDDRTPLSAIALHADTSAATAIGNDYGPGEVYARQVRAHGRAGDVFVGLSTSGSSENVCAAAKAARSAGLTTWALTGPAPNTLESICDEALPVPAADTATIQEVHLAVVHAVCAALDGALSASAVGARSGSTR